MFSTVALNSNKNKNKKQNKKQKYKNKKQKQNQKTNTNTKQTHCKTLLSNIGQELTEMARASYRHVDQINYNQLHHQVETFRKLREEQRLTRKDMLDRHRK